MKTLIAQCWPLVFFTFSILNLSAQDQKSELKIIAEYDESGVALRWAPTDSDSWHLANKKGYILQKARIPKTTIELRDYNYALVTDTIRPWSSNAWENIVENDDYAAAAWTALYQERPLVKGADLATTLHNQEDLKTKSHFLAMLAADHSQNAALALGLAFVDKDVKSGERYIYRVFIAGDEKSEGLVFQDCSKIQSKVIPQKPETISEEKSVLVKWDIEADRNVFTSYYIERAESADGPFKRLNEVPYIHLTTNGETDENKIAYFKDSVGVNYKVFYYRLTGINPFAKLSQPSEIVTGMGRDLTPPEIASEVQAKANTLNQVEISWLKTKAESDFAGFIVARCDTYEGPFEPVHIGLLDASTRTYTDTFPDYTRSNYYIVQTIDTAGNVSNSESAYAFFRDTIPPEAPKGLSGSIDSTGKVKLRWNKVEDPSLLGYRVYFSNSPNHTFIMRDGDMITDTFYQEYITLQTLSEKILYKVASVDVGYGHSDMSEVLELKKPDIIPPTSGVFKSWNIDKNAIKLTWAQSSSEDAVVQQLWRKKDDNDWQQIAEGDMTLQSFSDQNLEPKSYYTYALKTIDDDGLQSEFSTTVTVFSHEFEELPTVKNLRVNWDDKSGIAKLYWEYVNNADLSFIIFRAEGTGPVQSYDFVNSVNEYPDLNAHSGNEYSYSIRVRNANGDESPLSQVVILVVPNKEGK